MEIGLFSGQPERETSQKDIINCGFYSFLPVLVYAFAPDL